VRLAKREFELPVMLGLGNVSYGMPVRSFIDSIYLAMAAANGLDVTIVDPLDEQVMNTVRAVRMFLNLDRNASEFLDAVQDTGFGGFARADGSRDTQHLPAELDAPPAAAPAERQLYRAVLEGNQAAVPSLVEAVAEEGVPPLELLEDTLMNGMERVGELYEEGTYYLPQLMQSAEAMKLAVQQLAPLLEEQTGMSRGTIVLATVEGDMHDIGKNIVTLLLENYGFEVIDMGRDVAAAEIVHRAKEVAADLVGLSALMTTTMPRMKEVVQKLRGAGLTMPIMVGGAATTSEFAEHIGADGHGRNAQEAVKMAVQLIESEQTDQGCDGR
jgi:5-methyltetrahydrofolate--homocysteine methyltransferase